MNCHNSYNNIELFGLLDNNNWLGIGYYTFLEFHLQERNIHCSFYFYCIRYNHLLMNQCIWNRKHHNFYNNIELFGLVGNNNFLDISYYTFLWIHSQEKNIHCSFYFCCSRYNHLLMNQRIWSMKYHNFYNNIKLFDLVDNNN